MANERTKGKAEEIKGKTKKHAGDLMNDEKMQGEGMVEETKGKARQKIADLKDKAKKAA